MICRDELSLELGLIIPNTVLNRVAPLYMCVLVSHLALLFIVLLSSSSVKSASMAALPASLIFGTVVRNSA